MHLHSALETAALRLLWSSRFSQLVFACTQAKHARLTPHFDPHANPIDRVQQIAYGIDDLIVRSSGAILRSVASKHAGVPH